MRGAILAHVERVVREHPHGRNAHERGEADCGLAVVAEDGERGAERAVASVRLDAVHDCAHAELAHAPVEVASGEIFCGNPPEWLEVRLVGGLEVGGAANEERHFGGDGAEGRAACGARGHGLRWVEGGKLRGEVLGN